MKSLYNIDLGLDSKYTDLIRSFIRLSIVFATVLFLKDTKELRVFDTFIYVLVGELFYHMVLRYLISIQ